MTICGGPRTWLYKVMYGVLKARKSQFEKLRRQTESELKASRATASGQISKGVTAMDPHRDYTLARWLHGARFYASVHTPTQNELNTLVFWCQLFSLPIQQDSGYEALCVAKMWSSLDAPSEHPTKQPPAPRGRSMNPSKVGILPPIVLGAV